MSNTLQTLSAHSQSETKRMRNRNTRKGDAGRNASSRSTPKKDSKPDKSKGLANHIFASGKSEDFQKTCEHLMSHAAFNEGDKWCAPCKKNHKMHMGNKDRFTVKMTVDQLDESNES